MAIFRKRVKINNIEETNRLSVVRDEPVLREKLPSERQLEAIRDAREYLFQNTPQIKRLTN